MALLSSSHTLIFFIGFSGSGKTTVGRKIARRLGFNYCDLDEMIESMSGLTTSQIFSQKGEKYFRELENQCLKKVITNKYTVVSCGGGTPMYFNNLQLMKEAGITIYLKMSTKALCYRLERSKKTRPLLGDAKGDDLVKKIDAIIAKREPFYNQAQITVAADKLDMMELVRLVRNYRGS
jgi:shikimate kinase